MLKKKRAKQSREIFHLCTTVVKKNMMSYISSFTLECQWVYFGPGRIYLLYVKASM